MNKPKISIIVPVYKVEAYLPRCIESILAQTISDFELLLVVDGSPDHSGAICQQYAQQDTRIQVFLKENGGVSSARNYGLDHATGQWIVFIDSDDWVEPIFLQTLLQAEPLGVDMAELRQQVGKTGDFYTYIANPDFSFSVWNKLFRASLLKDIRFNQQLKIGEDLIFLLEFFKKTTRIHVIQSPVLYRYNIREGSAMTTIKSRVDSDLNLSDYLYATVGTDFRFLPIYYRLVADNRRETDKGKMKLLIRKTLGKLSPKEYLRLLVKDPVLFGKCLVRTLRVFF